MDVLLIEDHPVDRKLVRAVLKSGGHVVRDTAKWGGVERVGTRAAIAGASRYGLETRSML